MKSAPSEIQVGFELIVKIMKQRLGMNFFIWLKQIIGYRRIPSFEII